MGMAPEVLAAPGVRCWVVHPTSRVDPATSRTASRRVKKAGVGPDFGIGPETRFDARINLGIDARIEGVLIERVDQALQAAWQSRRR